MTKQLVIHAGLHKTGTSFLQVMLVKNKEELKSIGWEFLHTTTSGNSSSHISVTKDKKIKSKIKNSFINLISNPKEENSIISAEYLSFIDDESELLKVKNVCDEFYDKIKIIFYLRSHEELALSFKQQAAKSPSKDKMPSSMLVGHDFSPLPKINDDVISYFSYYKKIKLWSKVFGKENIHLGVYGKETNKETYFDDFLETCGVKLNNFTKIERTVNEGLDRRSSIVKHYLLSRGFSNSNLKSVANDEKIKPSDKDIKEFKKIFSEDIKMLKKEFSVDFPEKKALHKEESSNYQINYEDIDLILNEVKSKSVVLSKELFSSVRDYLYQKACSGDSSAYSIFNNLRIERENGNVIKKQQISSLKENLISSNFSKESRLKYYLGLYNTSRKIINKDFIRDQPFLYNPERPPKTPGTYVRDINKIIERVGVNSLLPMNFGDKPNPNDAFCFNKSRKTSDYFGVILRLNKKRHWDEFIDFHDPVQYDKKINSVVWRGGSTGYGSKIDNPRYKLVSKYYEKFNVGFSKLSQGRNWGNFVRDSLTIKEQLKYKYIIVIEGNDVATSLKWVLMSNSVPFMQHPTKETWLMEGILKPFVHYIPLNEDFSDLDEKIQWANENQDLTKNISEEGKNFMEIFSDESTECWIEDEIIKHFIKNK